MSIMDNLSKADGIEKEQVSTEVSKQLSNENSVLEETLAGYENLSMDEIVREANKVVGKSNPLGVSKQMSKLKLVFNKLMEADVAKIKTKFLEEGGESIDFKYENKYKKDFFDIYEIYKVEKSKLLKDKNTQLTRNLALREALIEELKELYSKQEDSKDSYQHFKSIEERWKNAGTVPHEHSDKIFKTYFHHVNNFYSYLKMNRRFRDMDFKKNLEKREHLILRAKELVNEPNIQKAFNELQYLHKVWKEEVGPVDHEHSETTWISFKAATKKIHDRRVELSSHLKEEQLVNLSIKENVVAKIEKLTAEIEGGKLSHNQWQAQIKKLETFREQFISSGKIAKEDNSIWDKFKTAVRAFNNHKNVYYKNLKKEQLVNLKKKRDIIDNVNALKDSTEWKKTAEVLKKVQQDWKKIGHVPRKYSDKLWKEFKDSTNYFFDRFHQNIKQGERDLLENYDNKKTYINEIKTVDLIGTKEEILDQINNICVKWSALGTVPKNKKGIEKDFHKLVEALLKNLNLSAEELEQVKFNAVLKEIVANKDIDTLNNMISDWKRKISDKSTEANQLENNLGFFSNANESNPLVKEVLVRLEKQKMELKILKKQLKQFGELRFED